MEDKRLTCRDWNFGFKLGFKLDFTCSANSQSSKIGKLPPNLPKTFKNRVTEGLGGFLGALGGVLGVLEISWRHLGWRKKRKTFYPWALGASWKGFGASWRRFGAILGRLDRLLGASWEVWEASRDHFGSIFQRFYGFLSNL